MVPFLVRAIALGPVPMVVLVIGVVLAIARLVVIALAFLYRAGPVSCPCCWCRCGP